MSAVHLTRIACVAVLFSALVAGQGCRTSGPSKNDSSLDQINANAFAAHYRRSLNEASESYVKLLAAEPPREPSAAEHELVTALAPQLFTVAGEPFPLEDVAVVIHPTRPLIAYHLFWDDDLDFPEDNDPTDHEIVWIEFDPATRHATRAFTYFHGKFLMAPAPPTGRVRIGVEWGKHGSVPLSEGGEAEWPANLHRNWERLHDRGIRLPEHPFARNWPKKFTGSFDDYTRFAVPVEPLSFIEQKGMVLVSRWANAVLDQHFLPYNFAPKLEWPE